FRNVAVNVGKETLKFHNAPSGMLVLHNTFVCPGRVLDIGDASPSFNFVVAGNLFVGPAAPALNLVVQWHGLIDGGIFDGNGSFPDGRFDFGAAGNWEGIVAVGVGGGCHAGVV